MSGNVKRRPDHSPNTSSLLSRSQAAIAASAPTSAAPSRSKASADISSNAFNRNMIISPIQRTAYTPTPRRSVPSPIVASTPPSASVDNIGADAASVSFSASTGIEWIDSMARVLRRQTAGMKRAADGDLLHRSSRTADAEISVDASTYDDENDDESFALNENADTSNNIFSPTTRRIRIDTTALNGVNKQTARVEEADVAIAKAELKRFNARFTAVSAKNDALTAQSATLEDAIGKRDVFIQKLIGAFVALKTTHDQTLSAKRETDAAMEEASENASAVREQSADLRRQLSAAIADATHLRTQLAEERKRDKVSPDVEARLVSANHMAEERRRELDGALTEIDRLEKVEEANRQEITRLSSAVNTLERAHVVLTAQNDDIRKATRSSTDDVQLELTSLRSENESLRDSAQSARHRSEEVQSALVEALSLIRSKDEQIAALNEHVTTDARRSDAVAAAVSGAEAATAAALRDDNERLRDELDVLKLEIAHRDVTQKQAVAVHESALTFERESTASRDALLRVANEKCAALNTECGLLDAAVTEAKASLAVAASERDEAKAQIVVLQQSADDLRSELSRVSEDAEKRLSDADDESRVQAEQLRNELDRVYAEKQDAVSSAEGRVVELEERLRLAEQIHDEDRAAFKSELSAQSTAEVERLRTELSSAQACVLDLQSALSRTRLDLESAQADLAAAEESESSRADDMTQFSTTISELMNQVKDDQIKQKDQSDAIETMRQRIADLENANSALQRRLETQERTADDWSTEREQVEQRLSQVLDENDSLQEAVQNINSTVVTQLTDELNAARAKLSKAHIHLNEVTESHLVQLADKVERSDYDVLVQHIRTKEIEAKTLQRELNKARDELLYVQKELSEESERRLVSEQSQRDVSRQFEQFKRESVSREHSLVDGSHDALLAAKEEHRNVLLKKESEYRTALSSLTDRLHSAESELDLSRRRVAELERAVETSESARARQRIEWTAELTAARAEWDSERRALQLSVQSANAQYNRILTSPTKGGRNVAAEEAAAAATAALLSDHQQRIETLTAEKQQLIRTNGLLSEENSRLLDADTHATLLSDHNALKQEHSVAIANATRLSDELSRVAAELSSSEQKYQESESALRELQTRFDEAKARFNLKLISLSGEYSAEIQSLQSEEQNIHSRHVEEIAHVKTENDSLKRELSAVKQRMQEAAADVTDLTETVNRQSAERAALIEQINSLQVALDSARVSVRTAQSAADKDNVISHLTNDKQSLHAQLKLMQTELSSLTASLPSLTSLNLDLSERDQLRLQIAEERNRLTQSEANRARLNVELTECQNELRAHRTHAAALQQQINQQMQNMTEALLKWDNERVRFMQTITQLKHERSSNTQRQSANAVSSSSRSLQRDTHPPSQESNDDEIFRDLYAAEVTLRNERALWAKQRVNLETQIHRALTQIAALKAENNRQIAEAKVSEEARDEIVSADKYIELELKCARYKERSQQFRRHAAALHKRLREQQDAPQTLDAAIPEHLQRQLAESAAATAQWKERALTAEQAISEQSTALTSLNSQLMTLKQEQLHIKHVIPNIIRATQQALAKQVIAHLQTATDAHDALRNKNALLVRNFHKIKCKMNERYDALLTQHQDFMQTYETLIQTQRDDLLNDSVSHTQRSPDGHQHRRNNVEYKS